MDQDDDAEQALSEHRYVQVPSQRDQGRPPAPHLPANRQASRAYLRAATP